MKKNILDLKVGEFITTDTRLGIIWLVARIYVGWLWLQAGIEKIGDPAWTGDQAGTAITGFLTHSLTLTSGEHPAVLGWYSWLIQNVGMGNAELLSHLVAYGELVVGIALILGLFTGLAAGAGAFMNFNYMLAGTAGLNPLMFVIQVLLIFAWRTAGWIGLDRQMLPKLVALDKKKQFFV